MDERIKQIFHNHFDDLREAAEHTTFRKTVYSYAMEELTDLYAEIFDISYDDAARELHDGAEKRNAAE